MLGLDTLRRARWRASQIGKRRTGSPRIFVIGVCQAGSIAKAMRFLLPDAQVDFASAFTAAKRFPKVSDLLAHAERYDAVFTSLYLPIKGGGAIEALRARPNVRVIPTIVFSAYHPDSVYVGVQDPSTLRGFVCGPMGASHSAVTLFSYLAGHSQEQALRLFSAPVFERLGYFDFWNESVSGLVGLGEAAGYPLDTHLTRWARRGCFMHSINHPKLHVVADLARGLLTRAGIPYEACDLDAFLPDDLGGQGSWPVYPEIAEHYGVPGSALFFKAETPRTGPARTMTRAAFVAESYAGYDRRRREDLTCPRVQAWRDDPATVEFLREAAGRAPSTSRPLGYTAAVPAATLAGHAS
jgi:hypothetical protein